MNSKVKFKDIAFFTAGQSPQSEYYSNKNGTPFMQGNRTFTMKYPFIDTYTTKITKKASQGDILISVRAPVGDLNIAPCDLCIGRGLGAIKAKDGNNEFLYYALKSNIKNLIKKGTGTTFSSITKDIIDEFELILPNKNKDKISILLSKIDEKIENNCNINKKLEQVSNLIYNYWFLQFEFPNKEGKPYKSFDGKMIWSEELKKEIPEGWTYENIDKITDIYQPETISENDLKVNGNYLVYGANGIIGKYDKYNHINNEIAITCRGASCGNIHMTQPYSWITGNSMVISPKKNFEYKEYLYHALNIKAIKQFISGTAQPQITRTNLSNLKLIIPSSDTITKFEKIAQNIRCKIQHNERENSQLISLRDFLLPFLMNGQVDFKDE